ncbi:PREDICTED: uncharacterized protein LOC104599103 isoform X2 [Nelumbo nucifera]|uniref:Uncharacterized protein LOC104599103 isoform X2 n=1 Tax=Nelumbo nucifera TaxID=4432 RepID=A0A1U8Q6F0_NELNU|nr:PREDICTED: uncharacterized protein LOC104599103 isoform X2 [Nelumbo nucifera]
MILMCNQGTDYLRRSSSQSDNFFDQQQHQQQYQAVYRMESPAAAPPQIPSSNEETPRVKFLCSFAGSILPRPQDGKLRYVGGETRIVSLPRDITYEELMVKMRELFEGAALLKYQQPDEDLDALVSVVNDDDVTNMMEEYDKLGSGDGFTRLRIFLFSHPDQDASSHFDTDERETERRYVDALNSLNDASDFRKQQQQQSDSPMMGPAMAEQFFNSISLEPGIHNQRNCDIPLPQYNLHLKIPHLGSGPHQQPHSQRYSEMEGWNPAYYSPSHHGPHDPRPMSEFPTSPSSSRYRMTFGELPDKSLDRMSEMNHQPPYDHQATFVDNVVWLPPGAMTGEKAGFPGNLSHTHNFYEGNNICEHCRMAFQRSQTSPDSARYTDPRWKHGGQSHLEQPNPGNGFHQFSNPCTECGPSRENYILNTDAKLDHGIFPKEKNEARSFYNEVHSHERGWVLHHQLNHRGDEPRTHLSGAGTISEHYVVDGTGMSFPLGHGTCCDGHHVPSSNCINHEDPRYIRPGPELGNDGFHDRAMGTGLHIHVPAQEDRGVCYGNFAPAYGTEGHYQVAHGPGGPGHGLWRKVQNPLHGTSSYETSNLLPQVNGTVNSGFLRSPQEGSPRYRVGMDNPNPWAGPSQKVLGFDGSAAPEYFHGYARRVNSNIIGQENQTSFGPDPSRSPTDMLDFANPTESVPRVPSSYSAVDDKVAASTTTSNIVGPRNDTDAIGATMEDKNMLREVSKPNHAEHSQVSNLHTVSYPEKNGDSGQKNDESGVDSNCLKSAEKGGNTIKLGGTDVHDACEDGELSTRRLSFLPELIASVKKAALEGAEEVKARAQGNAGEDVLPHSTTNEAAFPELEATNTHVDVEVDSDSDHQNISKIEPTKAEEEALAKGLQTIKNDDLEEIRELGSGTYGAVYHGKWKGSDVAIKRIKASCFAGKPSERERLLGRTMTTCSSIVPSLPPFGGTISQPWG